MWKFILGLVGLFIAIKVAGLVGVGVYIVLCYFINLGIRQDSK